MSDLERELKELIVSSLGLEDVTPDDIQSNEPLFGEGLGLDSIDGLELGNTQKIWSQASGVEGRDTGDLRDRYEYRELYRIAKGWVKCSRRVKFSRSCSGCWEISSSCRRRNWFLAPA
jgi:acyl carrier protein